MLESDLLTPSTIKRYQGDVPSPVRVTVCPRKIVSIPLNEMKASSTENCICAILQLADVTQGYQQITFLKNSNYRKMKHSIIIIKSTLGNLSQSRKGMAFSLCY